MFDLKHPPPITGGRPPVMSGDELRDWRIRLDMTQEVAAEVLGLDRVTWWRYEHSDEIPGWLATLTMVVTDLRIEHDLERPTQVDYRRQYMGGRVEDIKLPWYLSPSPTASEV